MADKLRVGVIGAGRWSASAHLPGFTRSPLCDVVMICDLDRELAERRAHEFGIPEVTTDWQQLLARPDIDVVDIVTRADNHEELSFATLEAGKHCLVEKPVCHDYRDVWRADALARSKGLKTKVGLTFRYAPAIQYMFELIRDGFIGEPYVFNGYEQNSQWINPDNPQDKRIHKVKPADEPLIGVDPRPRGDRGLITGRLRRARRSTSGSNCAGSDLTQVVGILANMVPYRRRTNLDTERERINVDDADMFIGRMRQRRPVLHAEQLRDGGQLSRHRSSHLRLQGRADRTAGRGIRRMPDAARRAPGCGRVRAHGDSRSASSRTATSRANAGIACSTPTWCTISCKRSSTAGRPTRATSPKARGCRRSSTRSRCRIASSAGSSCRCRRPNKRLPGIHKR